jgi:hypothetical protein
VPDVHARSLATSTALSEYYVADLIPPLEVIRVLNRAGVRFVLAGAHGLGGWTKAPRATEDVDVVVAARGQRKAVAALLAAFPGLSPEEHDVVTRLRERETGTVRIDVMKPVQDVYRAALKNTHAVRSGGEAYNVPSLEMALAMKFAAMISLTRSDEKKHFDAGDFIRMVKVNADIDLEQLRELGQLVYNGGGGEVVENVRKVRAGEKLSL